MAKMNRLKNLKMDNENRNVNSYDRRIHADEHIKIISLQSRSNYLLMRLYKVLVQTHALP